MIVKVKSPSKEPCIPFKNKTFDVQYHFVRDMIEKNKVLLEKVEKVENFANLLTKSVSIEKFTWCKSEMGLTSLSN